MRVSTICRPFFIRGPGVQSRAALSEEEKCCETCVSRYASGISSSFVPFAYLLHWNIAGYK